MSMNRELLEKPFAPDQIKQRTGTFGNFLDYIEAHAIIKRLNDAFNEDTARITNKQINYIVNLGKDLNWNSKDLDEESVNAFGVKMAYLTVKDASAFIDLLKDVKEMIGHRDLSMTDRYAHLNISRKLLSQEKLARFYSSNNGVLSPSGEHIGNTEG